MNKRLYKLSAVMIVVVANALFVTVIARGDGLQPGEPFVQFQLAAQKARPNRFVCVAGYGECALWYIGEDRIYTDRGGFEQSWSFVGPCEPLLHQTIVELLSKSSQTSSRTSNR